VSRENKEDSNTNKTTKGRINDNKNKEQQLLLFYGKNEVTTISGSLFVN
jgi:hypothetical protein